MKVTFPNESDDYRQARNALLQSEAELRAKVEEVAALRRILPQGGKIKEDYEFRNIENQSVKLSKLFQEGKNALFLYSFMYGPNAESPCPACTSMLDSLDGSAPHITQACNLAVVISGSTEQANSIIDSREWKNLNLLSCSGNEYNRHYYGESPDGNQMPMMNVFHKEKSQIYHFWGSELLFAPIEGHSRHIDQIWPMWNVLDLTPNGRTIAFPKLNYEE